MDQEMPVWQSKPIEDGPIAKSCESSSKQKLLCKYNLPQIN